MNNVLKIVIKFNKLVQNIEKTKDKSLSRKERIWLILDCPVNC